MRILQINATCGVGSTGRIALDIQRLLVSQGHESQIAYARKTSRFCPDAIRFGGNLNFLFHVAYTFITDRHAFASSLATRRLLREIEAYNPDLIHLHAIHGYYLNIRLLFDYLKQRNKPVVWTMHDCWAFTGHCAYFDYAGCNKWKTGCSHCPEKHHYPISLLLDNSVRNYADKKRLFNQIGQMTLVSPSRWLKDLLALSFLKNYPAVVINNGVNLEVFAPRLPAENQALRERYNLTDRFIILAVASVWDERKGYPAILELAGMLRSDEVLMMVGLTPRQKDKLPKSIIGITKTNNIQELADLYAAADVFINPTLDDNLPTTNIESLACGTPVITYRTGGSIEIIDEATGLVANQGDLEDLLAKIRIIRKRGKSAYTDACRSRAVALYERNTKYQEYIDLYQTLLDIAEPAKKEWPAP